MNFLKKIHSKMSWYELKRAQARIMLPETSWVL